MIIRATRDLPPDTEITHWYQVPFATGGYDKRQEKLRNWGFVCNCAICQDDRTAGMSTLLDRERLGVDIQTSLRSSGLAHMATVQSDLASIERSYSRPAVQLPRLSLWQPMMVLADTYMRYEQPSRAINALLGALQLWGMLLTVDLCLASHAPHW